jgi:hypothetical protein
MICQFLMYKKLFFNNKSYKYFGEIIISLNFTRYCWGYFFHNS